MTLAKDSKPLVSVVMITYNHGPFIFNAIMGILNQKCEFPVELIIADDRSSDKTVDVIEDIINKYKGPFRIRFESNFKNKGMTGNFIDALDSAEGTFIAICEGDDYWTDSLKLQKQVEFLQSNLDYSVCWTRYSELKLKDNIEIIKEPVKFNRLNYTPFYEVNLENFNNPYVTQTLTCLFRRDLFNRSESILYKFFKDNTLFAILLRDGKGALLNFNSGVYRINERSVYALQSQKKKAVSNYTNFYEIVKRMPGTYMPSIVQARNYWENKWLESLKKEKFAFFKEWSFRLKLKMKTRHFN